MKKISLSENPKKIVIVSVNHFNAGQKDILLTKKDWDFSERDPKINTALADKLLEENHVGDDDSAFETEHGIKNVFPDLISQFPDAEYLPIIIKDKASKDDVQKLSDLLFQKCPECLLVGSIDFSHYNPNSLAQIHDQTSISAIKNMDEQKAWDAESDSPQSLLLAMDWAKRHKTENFDLFFNSNSGEQSKNDDIETTSVVVGGFSDRTSATKIGKSTTFIFAGDMMFDRMIYHQFKSKGLEKVFDNIGERVFWGTDISFANLEGPISPSPILDDTSADNLIFNFPPQTPAALQFLNLNSVSLANNHTGNAGAAGYETTKKILADNNIKFAGSPEEIGDYSVLRFDSEIPVSIIALNVLSANGNVEKYIAGEKSAGRFVIVFPHWGGEYQAKHNTSQSKLAREWIDQGADMVVGSHPHVVQDFEIYKDKPIVYSLGNFVFDQTFSWETQEGLILAGVIRERGLELTFLPTKQVKYKPELMRSDEKAAKIEKIFDVNSRDGFTKLRSDTIKLPK